MPRQRKRGRNPGSVRVISFDYREAYLAGGTSTLVHFEATVDWTTSTIDGQADPGARFVSTMTLRELMQRAFEI